MQENQIERKKEMGKMIRDILDVLPEKELAAVESAGYALLHRHGYRVKGARRDGRVRARIRRDLARRGHRFGYSVRRTEGNAWKLFFILRGADGRDIGRSPVFLLKFGGKGATNSEAQRNTTDL